MSGGNSILDKVKKGAKKSIKGLLILIIKHPIAAFSILGGSATVVIRTVASRRLMAVLLAIVSTCTQIFDDDTVVEPQCTCKWVVRTESTSRTSATPITEATTTGTILTGDTNREKIWNFMISHGMTPIMAAGVVGNAWAESHWESRVARHVTDIDSYIKKFDDGTETNFDDHHAFGLFQWLSGDRKNKLLAYAKEKGTSIGDMQTQLEFFLKELKENYSGTYANLEKATTPSEAADTIRKGYEGTSEAAQTRRDYAEAAYKDLKDKVPSTGINSSASTTPTTSPTTSTVTSTSSENQAMLNPNLTGTAKKVIEFCVDLGNKSAARYKAWNGEMTNTDNNCARFVSTAYEQAGVSDKGTGMGVGANSMSHRYTIPMQGDTPDWGRIPLGAYVVFQRGSGSMGYTYGHVGIYVGYNKIVDAGGSTVKVHDANTWWKTFYKYNEGGKGWTGYDVIGSGGKSIEPLMYDDGTPGVLPGSGGESLSAQIPETGTPGVPSGLWPSLLTDVSKHTGEWTKLKADVGKAPLSGDKLDLNPDKFKAYNGRGTIRYMQNKSGGTLIGTFATLQYNNAADFPSAGCGICATAIVLSTLTGRYVNPAEVALAGMTYSDRHSGTSVGTIFSGNGTNVIFDSGIQKLCEEAGLKAELKPLKQEDVNACLSQDGMVIGVYQGSGFSSGTAGHYSVIREQDSTNPDSYYLVQSAGFDLDTKPIAFSALASANSHPEVIYVYPSESLNLKFGGLGTGTGTGQTSITKGKKYILYHTGNEHCAKHNGYYCSCGLKAALDIRQEYEIYAEDLETIISETSATGEEVPLVKQIDGITPISQNNIGYPTGCEITSLTMLLNSLGFSATVDDINSKYLATGDVGKTDPNKAFVGNPKSAESFGCFAPVIVDTANKFLAKQDTDLQAVELTGKTLESLLDNYIARDNAVLVWVSQDLKALETGPTWIVNGESITWKKGEHCVLLTGYDKTRNIVSVADPLKGCIVEYDMDLFKQRYEEMGSMAVAIPKSIGNSKFTEFVWPMKDKDKVINDTFTSSGRKGHGALDIDRRGDSNCPIVAAYAGEVVYAQFKSNGYGYQVAIKHNFDGEELYTKYNHMSKVTVKVGDIVKAGDQVGVVGGTGKTKANTYAIHLDFQMYTQFSINSLNSHLVNPACVLLGLVDRVSELSEFTRSGNYSITCTKRGKEYAYASKRFSTYSGMSWNEFCSHYKKE